MKKDVNNRIVGFRASSSLDLKRQVFDNRENSLNSLEYLDRVILAPKNDDVNTIDQIL